jgi:hypothetical protein
VPVGGYWYSTPQPGPMSSNPNRPAAPAAPATRPDARTASPDRPATEGSTWVFGK